MAVPLACPHCDADLKGDPIPPPYRALYGRGATHYSRAFPIYETGRSGPLLSFQCPICGMVWPKGQEKAIRDGRK